jgi:hypothetical protein
VTGEVPSVESIAAYLRDAAQAGSSMWSVVNVLRHHVSQGAHRCQVTRALAIARSSRPQYEAVFDSYANAIQTLL